MLSCNHNANSPESESKDKFAIEQDLETYIFGRHRFADKDEDFYNGGEFGTRVEKGNFYFYHAKEFMADQLSEFNRAMQNESNETFKQLAQNMVDNNKFNASGTYTIDQVISQNNFDCGKFFGHIEYNIADDDDYFKFVACYDYLANRAYNDSLGAQAGTRTKANEELAEIKQELSNLGIAANDQNVEGILCDLLDEVEKKTGVRRTTLVKGVNIALYNEGMWGVRDLGGSAEAITSDASPKTPNMFDRYSVGERSRMDFDRIAMSTMEALFRQEQQATATMER